MSIKIYIDQGHNPRDYNTGAEGNGYYEQDITYEIGRRCVAEGCLLVRRWVRP